MRCQSSREYVFSNVRQAAFASQAHLAGFLNGNLPIQRLHQLFKDIALFVKV